MPERSVSRAERLNKIEHLLLAHPEGLTQAENAKMGLGFCWKVPGLSRRGNSIVPTHMVHCDRVVRG